MKKNYTGLIFAIAFTTIAIARWKSFELIDGIFYIVAIFGFLMLFVMCILQTRNN